MIARRRSLLSSSRLSVDLPATGAQSSRTRLKLARQHRHHRIVAQLVVVVEILVAERDPEHPLADQRRDLVLDQLRRVARRESTPQTDRSVRSHDRSLPTATRRRPTSPSRHQTRLPQRGLRRFQNRTVLRYTLSASGLSANRLKWLLHNNFR